MHEWPSYGGGGDEPQAIPESGLAPERVRAGGCDIHHVDVGPRDAPALLLLPGLVATHRYFRRNIGPLAARFRVLAPDLPGFGRSEKPDAPYTPEWFVDKVLAFLDEKGVSRAHVAGNSLGGQVAMALALAAPERVDRLVLVSPAGMLPYSQLVSRLLDVAQLAVFPRVGLPRLPRVPRAALAILFKAAFPTRPDIARTYTRGYALGVASPEYPLYMRAAFRALRGSVCSPMLRRARDIATPTLIVWGARDMLLPVSSAGPLSRAIVGSRLLVYEESGHCAMIDQAERWNRDVEQFLLDGAG